MAHTKNKNKRKPSPARKIGKKDGLKMHMRYMESKEALSGYTSLELKDIFKDKMSSTDRRALIDVTSEKLREEMAGKLKDEVTDESKEADVTEGSVLSESNEDNK